MSRVKPFIEEYATTGRDKKWSSKGFRVGARYKSDTGLGIGAPVADVHVDEDWVHIVTDDYEGHAMLHLETIPYLRRALFKLEKERKAKAAEAEGNVSRGSEPKASA